jgi:hypothetical protein
VVPVPAVPELGSIAAEASNQLFWVLDASAYLCKLRGTLRPAQMQSDLVLAAAADNEPYREWLWVR